LQEKKITGTILCRNVSRVKALFTTIKCRSAGYRFASNSVLKLSTPFTSLMVESEVRIQNEIPSFCLTCFYFENFWIGPFLCSDSIYEYTTNGKWSLRRRRQRRESNADLTSSVLIRNGQD